MRNFEICLEIYELDPAKFFSAPELAWQAVLKSIKVKLNLLTDIDALLMVEKGIRGRISHTTYRYVKANNKYMKNYDKNKEPSYLKCWDEIIYIDEKTSQFNKYFMKDYSDDSNEGHFIKTDVQYPENLHNLHNDLPFCPKE